MHHSTVDESYHFLKFLMSYIRRPWRIRATGTADSGVEVKLLSSVCVCVCVSVEASAITNATGATGGACLSGDVNCSQPQHRLVTFIVTS